MTPNAFMAQANLLNVNPLEIEFDSETPPPWAFGGIEIEEDTILSIQ